LLEGSLDGEKKVGSGFPVNQESGLLSKPGCGWPGNNGPGLTPPGTGCPGSGG